MKQKLKRFMAGFMAMLTLVGTLFTNGTTAFAASPQANIAFWNASVKNSGEVSELKPGYNHGKILYSILDGNSAYCMNFGLRADGGQLMNSYDDASTSMSAQQRKLLSYCLYYGFNSTQKAAPSNSQCDEYIATQAMVWVIVADIFGTGSGDSAARKLCNTAPSPDTSYSYYERLRDNISSSYNATLPSFASRRTSEAPTYELKWNDGSQRFETTLSDSNGVLSDFDFGISGYSVDKNGKPFKCDVTGNDKNYGFNVVNVNSTELVVFEAAIDLMSYVDIFTDYESNKLALGMLADAPLETFLREHPQITSIRFCLDGDEPGRKAAAELMRKYYELGYEVEDCPPPAGYKDYNEWLVAAKLNLNRMNKRDYLSDTEVSR